MKQETTNKSKNVINKAWFIPMLFAFSFTIVSFIGETTPTTKEFVDAMVYKIKHLKTLRFDLSGKERLIGGKVTDNHAKVKMNLNPYKLYTLIPGFTKGQEFIYIDGWNDNDAYVNPNGFPYVNLNLDPQHALMREGQHHSILEMGFSYLIDLLEQTRIRHTDLFYKCASIKGSIRFFNRNCYLFEIEHPTYKHLEYVCKKGETVLSIARANLVSEYLILEINPGITLLDVQKVGKRIRIPSNYGKKINMYVDKITYIPYYIKVWDDKGVFEEYTFENVQINPLIAPEEFTTNYKEYRF